MNTGIYIYIYEIEQSILPHPPPPPPPCRWDCWETDRRGRTALFWAAGGGSVGACSALTEGDGGLRPCDSGGDGSTPLHWAAAGVEAKRFGTGGDVDVSSGTKIKLKMMTFFFHGIGPLFFFFFFPGRKAEADLEPQIYV